MRITNLTWRNQRLAYLFAIFCACLLAMPAISAFAQKDKQILRVGVRGTSQSQSWLEKQFSIQENTNVNHLLLKKLARLLNVDIKYVLCSTLVERREFLRQGKIDLISLDSPQLTPDPAFEFIHLGLAISRQLFVHNSQCCIIGVEDLRSKRIAVLAGDNYEAVLGNALGSTLKEMDKPIQALRALNSGEVDAFLAPSARTAESIIISEELNNVVKVGKRMEEIDMCLTIRKSDRELSAQLQDAVDRLTASGELKSLHEQWYDVHYSPNAWKRIFHWGAIGLTFAILLMLLVVFMNRRLKSQVVQMTDDLRSSEERYRSLIQHAPDMVVVLDMNLMIEHANPIAEQNLGKTGKPVLGISFLEFIPPEGRDDLQAFVVQVFKEGNGRREFTMHDLKGGMHEVDVAAKSLSTSCGTSVRICCFMRDVTQRNTIERELVQADRLSTIGKMAASMAHEINNPLGIVRANVELLLSREMYLPESKEFLEAIQRNTIRAGRITQELLAAAKPKTPEMRQVNLEELIRLSLAMLGPQLKKIEITQEVAKKPPLVLGDPNLLQQVLVNLLLNAKSAMNGREDPRLLIRFCPNADADNSIRLRIEDNGEGIARKNLREIFEPFFTTSKKEGFGLGLFIAKRIIDKHDGIIFAESEVGKGTYFIIELPSYHSADRLSGEGYS